MRAGVQVVVIIMMVRYVFSVFSNVLANKFQPLPATGT